jgi:hypothetical protein
MPNEVEFYRVCQEGRVRLSELRTDDGRLRAIVFINRTIEMAPQFGIDLPHISKITELPKNVDTDRVSESLFIVDNALEDIKARNIFEIDTQLKRDTIYLDDTWRAQVSAYVQHIRDIVQNAEVDDRLRQGIFQRLNILQREVDRNVSRLASITDAFVDVCGAIGEGAKRLEPAQKLLEKLTGSFKRLQESQQNADHHPQLPSPEYLGLPAPSEDSVKED